MASTPMSNDVIEVEFDEAAVAEALAEVFTEQIRAWRTGGGFGVPLLVLAPDVLPPKRGRCLSCGSPAERWRCAECLEAIELALDLADGERERLLPPVPIISPLLAEIEDCARERDLWRQSHE